MFCRYTCFPSSCVRTSLIPFNIVNFPFRLDLLISFIVLYSSDSSSLHVVPVSLVNSDVQNFVGVLEDLGCIRNDGMGFEGVIRPFRPIG